MSYNKFKLSKKELFDLCKNKTSYQISRLLKISQAGVYYWIKKYNIKLKRKQTSETKNKIKKTLLKKYRNGEILSPTKGKKYSKEHCKKLSKAFKGRKSKLKGIKRPDLSGENHPRWKGGKSQTLEKKLRSSIEWKQMRENIFKRDDYTCIECGKRGCELHPHHIIKKSKRPDLTFVESNIITLCYFCHIKTGKHKGCLKL